MASVKSGPTASSLMVNVFDGTRQLIKTPIDLLIRLIDGNQKQIITMTAKKASVLFKKLPFYDNYGDNYTVVVSADGYLQAGFTPVKLSKGTVQHIDLMLIPSDGSFNFSQARWETLRATRPILFSLLSRGIGNAKERYGQLMEDQPETLAGLLNITTAMADIDLPTGNPLIYLKELLWEDSMKQDRFLAWTNKSLLDQVKRAAAEGIFAPEFGTSLFHPGATCSYKQVQFGEANVQLTFHEGDTKTIDGIDCIKVEQDIDYYRDPAAHALLEIVPNKILNRLTDPRQVYVLRWIAGRHAGVPEFDPPYVIV